MSDQHEDDVSKRLQKTRGLQNLEQNSALLADYLPGLWHRMYQNLLKEGFEQGLAMEILKAYIISQGIRYS
jgi:hypothetical protein